MHRENLWAPWRMEYIGQLSGEGGCFLCDYLAEPAADDENFVVWRTGRCIVVMNRFPYNNGHLLIAPNAHVGDIAELDAGQMLELMELVRESKAALTEVIRPAGFNVGINLGRCAGAGLPGHLHIHVVPRWEGDTNFMAVCGQTDVVSQGLSDLLGRLRQVSSEKGYPHLSEGPI